MELATRDIIRVELTGLGRDPAHATLVDGAAIALKYGNDSYQLQAYVVDRAQGVLSIAIAATEAERSDVKDLRDFFIAEGNSSVQITR